MRKITVATDSSSMHQALYVDGQLKDQDSSLYASELAPFTDGQPVLVENINVALPKDWDRFPGTLEELDGLPEDEDD
ncbi:MAG: hypothetical protein ACTHK7_09175 [Aureliella sp.]